MGERREHDRTVIDVECELAIGYRRVRTRMMNFSDIGALFHVVEESPDAVTDDDLGSDAVFIHPLYKPQRQYTGEIIRRYFVGGVLYIALRFWNTYKTLP